MGRNCRTCDDYRMCGSFCAVMKSDMKTVTGKPDKWTVFSVNRILAFS